MKNNMRRKTLRAAALSLSTVLASSVVPVEAFAAGNDDDNNNNGKNVEVELYSESESEKVAAVEQVEETVNDADTAVDKVAADDANELEEIKKAEAVNIAAQKTEEANLKIEDVKEDAALIDSAESEKENAITDANDKVNEINKVAEDVNGKETAYEEAVKENSEAIENAKSINEANEAYNKIEKDASDAKAAYEEAKTEYDRLLEEYESALNNLADKQAAYDEAVSESNADIAAAAKALGEAKSEVEAIKTAADEAKADLNGYKMEEILNNESSIQNNDGTSYADLDKLFYSILNNYFIANQYNGTDIKVENFVKYSDSTKNYCKVTFKDENGEEVVKYLNYLPADGKDYKNGMVIFEKTEEKVVDQEAVAEGYRGEGDVVYSEDELIEINGIKCYLGKDVKPQKYALKKGEVIDESSKTDEYVIEKNGKITKYTYANLIATNEVEDNFESAEGVSFASKDEAKAAAEAELAKIDNVTSSDITVVENEIETPYIATHTISYTDAPWSNIKAGDKVGDQYVIAVNSKVNGIVDKYSLEVADIVEEKVSYTFADQFKDLFRRNTDQAIIEAKIKEQVEKDGGIYIGFSAFNWDFETAKVRYVKASTKTDYEYTYKVDYKANEITVLENRIIEETKYNQAETNLTYSEAKEEVSHIEYTNKDFNENKKDNTLLDEYNDEAFRAYLASASKYDQLIADLEDADKAIATAKDEVAKLTNTLNALSYAGNTDSVEELKAKYEKKLDEAKKALEDAEATKDNIQKLADEAKVTLEETVRKLTPAPVNPAPTPARPASPAVAPVVRNVTPAVVDEDAPAVVDIDEEETPLAATPVKVTKKATKKAATASNEKENKKSVRKPSTRKIVDSEEEKVEDKVVIEDIETPKAATIDMTSDSLVKDYSVNKDEENVIKTSWWWLLIIALLGATGIELYARHSKKNEKKDK